MCFRQNSSRNRRTSRTTSPIAIPDKARRIGEGSGIEDDRGARAGTRLQDAGTETVTIARRARIRSPPAISTSTRPRRQRTCCTAADRANLAAPHRSSRERSHRITPSYPERIRYCARSSGVDGASLRRRQRDLAGANDGRGVVALDERGEELPIPRRKRACATQELRHRAIRPLRAHAASDGLEPLPDVGQMAELPAFAPGEVRCR